MDEKMIVSKGNGYLFSATQELCVWLNRMLPRVSDEWWSECVMGNLSYAQYDLAKQIPSFLNF